MYAIIKKSKKSIILKIICIGLLVYLIYLFTRRTNNILIVNTDETFESLLKLKELRKYPIERNIITKSYSNEENFDPNLPQLRNRILRISNAKQFIPQRNFDALYSNQLNTKLFTNLQAGFLNVYTWIDLCSESIDVLKAKIGFPYNPIMKSLTQTLRIEHTIKFSGMRIFGYISPPVSGTYSIQVTYYGSVELWLSPDSLPYNAIEYKSTEPNLFIRLTRKFITNNDQSPVCDYTVSLVADKKHYIEIIHVGKGEGLIEVKWKEINSPKYLSIESEYIFPFVHDFGRGVLPETYSPPTLPLHAPSSELLKILHPYDERNYLFYYSNIAIEKFAGSWVFPSCQYKPAFVEQKPEQGIPVSLELLSTYPADTLYSRHVHIIVRNAVISTEIMNKVLTIFMRHLTFSNPTIVLSRLVNMERLVDNLNGDLFLVEVLITDAQHPLKEHLISEFVVLEHRDMPPSVLCHPVDMKMHTGTFVHFLVTHRNFPQMIREFVQNMERVYDESGDENFGIIVVNYVTPLINVLTLLRQSRLKHWSVIDFQGPWEKTAAINIGIDSVKNPDDIIFITDLSIYYPSHLPDTIRKHTFQGFSGFAPVIFYFTCRFYPLEDYYGTYSIYGYGLFSLYKSDWEVVGGMDSTRFKGKWGWEDNDLADRVITAGYTLFRLVIRDFYHQNHTYSGLWDSNAT